MTLSTDFTFTRDVNTQNSGIILWKEHTFKVTVSNAEHADLEKIVRIGFNILLKKELPQNSDFVKATVSRSHIDAFMKAAPNVPTRIEHSDSDKTKDTSSFFEDLVREVKLHSPKNKKPENKNSTLPITSSIPARNLLSSTPAPALTTEGPIKVNAKIQNLKIAHKKQLIQFRSWAFENDWSKFASAHFDWWIFPISRDSAGHGNKYNMSQTEINELKNDDAFMADYREAFKLVLQSWGWNVDGPIAEKKRSPLFTRHSDRIGKAAQSARQFKEFQLFDNLKACVKANMPLTELEDWVQTNLAS